MSNNLITLKLTHLLAQYLYKNKRLDLQGLGSFKLDSPVVIESDTNKQSKEISIEGITFENNTAIKEDPALIEFISKYSGKIKALASADLDSHLELAKQFLNIGKPFLFEGIGSLTKIRSGEYSFTPGNVLTEKLTEQKIKDNSQKSTIEEPVSDYQSTIYKKTGRSRWIKPIIFLSVIIGIGLAIWGGYTVYKKTSPKKNINTLTNEPKDKTILLEDSVINTKDTTNSQPITTAAIPAGSTKFILEVSNKERAIERFNRLKTFNWDVNMETKDSVSYKLYLLIPATAADTSRILDSLTMLNGRKVYIEN